MGGVFKGRFALRCALLSSAVWAPTAGTPAAWAQPVPGPPSRPEITQPVPRERPPRAPRVERPRFQPGSCPLAAADITVQLDRVEFVGTGGRDLDPGVRAALAGIGPAASGAHTMQQLCELRDRAEAAVQSAGYIATAVIRPQRIETGSLRIEIVTSRIVEIRFNGDAPPYREMIAARVEQLKALDPLNERDAERILLLAGDVPGLDVRMSLQPAGTVPGEVIGVITLDYRPYSILANVSNLGSRQLGREAVYVRGEAYGLTGLGDVTYVGASSTLDFDEQRVAQIGHLTGLGGNGMTLEGSFLYAWSRPDIGTLDLRSQSYIASLVLTAPLRRTRRSAIALSGGFELIEQRTRVRPLGGGASFALNRDRLRVAFAQVEGEFRGYADSGAPIWSLLASLEIRQGLDILGATETGSISPSGYTPSRFSGDASALVVRGDIEGEAQIGPIFSLAGRASGQWTNDPLLNFEEFSIGNLTIGRGYDPGANSADRAIGLRGEVRARIPNRTSVRVDLFAFYDSVWIWNLDPFAVETDRRLGSWGGGVRALLPGRALLEVAYARPEDPSLLLPGARRAPDRLLVSLTFQFPPGGR